MSMSWLSASQQNNLALSSIKFDFTLIKLEAPTEFSGIGTVLGHRRKTDAENGGAHRTARKLGALFEHITPSTPKLIAAYGKRVSEIIDTPGINPRGSRKDGPFESFVGADATALWAAATSGVPAIAIYLLATLLANEWDHKTAVSVWVELVEERRKDIEKSFCSTNITPESSLVAARQEITRKELALWDSSARAWLRSANEAKIKQRDQFLLISKNIQLSDPRGSTTYEKLLNFWYGAMRTMEELLNGRPQSIRDRCIPSAIISWHLYPNLIVLARPISHIDFRDSLIPSHAKCEIGFVSSANQEEESTSQWSLALSHYQFYGEPVAATSEENFTRVDIKRFSVMAFGAMLGSWYIPNRDILMTTEWLLDLWNIIRSVIQLHRNGRYEGLDWLQCLVVGAKYFVDEGGLENETLSQILKFGKRRGTHLFVDNPRQLSPYFGLRCIPVFKSLQQVIDIECGIVFLRELASHMVQTSDRAIIMIDHGSIITGKQFRSIKYVEFVSAIAAPFTTGKRKFEENPVITTAHHRWLFREKGDSISSFLESLRDNDTNPIEQREASIKVTGETLFEEDEQNDFTTLAKNLWDSVKGAPSKACVGDLNRFRAIYNDSMFGLFVLKSYDSKIRSLEESEKLISNLSRPISSTEVLDLRLLSPNRLHDYMCAVIEPEGLYGSSKKDAARGVMLLSEKHRLSTNCYDSLQAISLAQKIYGNLDGATISTSIVTSEIPICNSRWNDNFEAVSQSSYCSPGILDIPSPLLWFRGSTQTLSRQQAFACIAHFECGKDILDPSSLDDAIAVSVGNSIYVAKTLLSDPFYLVEPYHTQRLVGNINHTGLSILVGPTNPRIRSMSNCYNVVEHKPYDMNRENNFASTSLHLHFTDWSLPVENFKSRSVDQDAYFVESVISVRDHGKWVADLDILSIDFENLRRLESEPCTQSGHKFAKDACQCSSIDTWDELLEFPESPAVFRAKGNWAARLAAVSILSQKGQQHALAVIGSDGVCLSCLETECSDVGLQDYEGRLPAFCID